MSTSTADAPDPDASPPPPLRSDFCDLLERLFNSRSPNFDHFATLLHRRYNERKEAGEDAAAEALWQMHRVPLDVAFEATERWNDLDDDTRRSVMRLLRSYEQKLAVQQQPGRLHDE
jgi:hypothetical protein